MKFTLPKPPSTNHIYGLTSFGGHARMYMTKKGKDWFENATIKMREQISYPRTIVEKVELTIDLYTAYGQDTDGIVKPTMDLLQKTELIKNDFLVYDLHVHKHGCKRTEERLEIELNPIENQVTL